MLDISLLFIFCFLLMPKQKTRKKNLSEQLEREKKLLNNVILFSSEIKQQDFDLYLAMTQSGKNVNADGGVFCKQSLP